MLNALRTDFTRTGVAAPLRVGIAVGIVLTVGSLIGHRDLAGFAALGALISAFCRPDPYPVRALRLVSLGIGITVTIGVGAVVGAYSGTLPVEIAAISLLAGIAVYLLSMLHIVGPGAVIFVFAATGAAGFANTAADVRHALVATVIGAFVGLAAALAPWLFINLPGRRRAPGPGPDTRSPSIWTGFAGGHDRDTHTHLIVTGVRVTAAAAISAAIAAAVGLTHPMWAAMGAVASLQGVAYHLTVRRGMQRLLGNVGGALIAAALLALPLGYWGAVIAIVVFQTLAEILSTVNYALCSLAVTPMALLLTGLGTGLPPAAALDRVLDTLLGIVVAIAVAALTIRRGEVIEPDTDATAA
ncbi:MAG: FUSC family protein [Gordonia sp. (in: high G+C Gram-positive bacteria)]